MKKALLNIFFVVLIITGCGDEKSNRSIQPAHNYSVIDDRSDTLSLASPPERVISLAPNITEMIYELNLEKYLVGNTTYCYYPEEAKQITKVGDLLSINYETITTLKPDLIFVTMEGNTLDVYNKLQDLGFTVFVSNPRTFDGIKKTFRDIAKIFQVSDTAETIIKEWDRTVHKISTEAKELQRKRAMFMVSVKPIMLAGGKTFVNEFLELCNLQNIAEDADANYPFFTREEVLKRNPEFIFHTQMEYSESNSVETAFEEWDQLDAVKNDRIYLLDSDLFFRPGPRFTEALQTLFNIRSPHNHSSR